ncbi:hypothetical protein F3Y22_tig00111059pilonHSYRG00058 [Hibiscus syriacus]|uniref:Protein kinase domain-containing protein n=1 Tax=Hibiscus syriacus TaxID=106335 RepID=A0A6A2Z4X3_HIBSY|nr:hypothetical protein F3Y22_tig00111059pilonHSYRG00058 [Hibiscus syriacus]
MSYNHQNVSHHPLNPSGKRLVGDSSPGFPPPPPAVVYNHSHHSSATPPGYQGYYYQGHPSPPAPPGLPPRSHYNYHNGFTSLLTGWHGVQIGFRSGYFQFDRCQFRSGTDKDQFNSGSDGLQADLVQIGDDRSKELKWSRIESLERSISPVAKSLVKFNYGEIVSATRKFSEENGVDKVLGRRASSFVFRGRVGLLKTTVAIKRLDKEDKKSAKAFCREVMIASSLHHPNIVPLLGSLTDLSNFPIAPFHSLTDLSNDALATHSPSGNIEMNGTLDAISSSPADARISKNSTMVGVGMCMEGIDQNSGVYELMSEMAH